MSICTNCGAIIHPEDVEKHVCNPINAAVKGVEKQPLLSEVALKSD
jgi:hypothetical protein